MTHQCQACTGSATLYLCKVCIRQLGDNLHALAHGPTVNGHPTAGLLDACQDVVLRRTRLSTDNGHRKKGDELPAPFLPDETRGIDDDGDAIPARDKHGRMIVSRQQRAALLLTQARHALTTITRDLCETRDIHLMRAFRVIPARFIGPIPPGWTRAGTTPWEPTSQALALWLAAHVHTIACDESAGQVHREVDSLVRQIERVVDRAAPMELLGFCTTEIDDKPCGEPLHAPADQLDVYCPRCHTTRRCDRVRMIAMSDARRTRVTWEQVLLINRQQPDGYRVAPRTLRKWREDDVLKPHGYLRSCGSRGVARHSEDDVPLYLWSDVERLRAAKPQKMPTGAAAHEARRVGQKVTA